MGFRAESAGLGNQKGLPGLRGYVFEKIVGGAGKLLLSVNSS